MLCGALSLSHVWLFATLWIIAFQAPLPMGILQAILIPTCASSSPAFIMMYSAYVK